MVIEFTLWEFIGLIYLFFGGVFAIAFRLIYWVFKAEIRTMSAHKNGWWSWKYTIFLFLLWAPYIGYTGISGRVADPFTPRGT